MSSFERIVSRETVLSFGVNEWDEEDQTQLHEAMILAWKEHPDWTDEEAKEACEEQVECILYQNFRRTYGQMIKGASNHWQYATEAYDDYVKLGKKKFENLLNEEVEFQDFCNAFYDTLREMWNIDGEGMQNAFNLMKEKKWSYSEYRAYLKQQV
jgi:hypothetical protein